MPIEIKELRIKAAIDNSRRESSPTAEANNDNMDRVKNEIIQEVTQEVLRLIYLKNER